MALQLNPYLHFDGNAREAMSFYKTVFGGELDVMTFGQMGDTGDRADLVMHSYLGTPDGYQLMGADIPPDQDSFVVGNHVSLSLSGDDEAKLRTQFDALAGGGEVHVPLEKQMWGDLFGQCRDRFGVIWLVNISEPS